MQELFHSRLSSYQKSTGGALCVGLDPDPGRLPSLFAKMETATAVEAFCSEIVDATVDLACSYKLNFAFFESLGDAGMRVLRSVRNHIGTRSLVIADAKRGDIGNSARFYAASVFDDLGFDACTVAPYMGLDAVEPFLAFRGRAAFVLARTSNPGGNHFQNLVTDGEPLFLRVARSVASWAEHSAGEAGLVVGATDLSAMRALRTAVPELPFLVPGVGAQGGNASDVLRAAGPGVLVNSSRAILYASAKSDFAAAAREAAVTLRNDLRI